MSYRKFDRKEKRRFLRELVLALGVTAFASSATGAGAGKSPRKLQLPSDNSTGHRAGTGATSLGG